MSRPHCSECAHWTPEPNRKWGHCDLKHSRPFMRKCHDGVKRMFWTSEYSYKSDSCQEWESTMSQLNPQEPINYYIENDGTYEGGE